MAFSTNCTQRGCGKWVEPLLDLRDNLIYCPVCNKTISNISDFTKRQLKSLGQVRTPAKKAFSIHCIKCKKDTLPKLDGSNKLICAWCNAILTNVNKFFEDMIRKEIAKGDKEEDF